MVSGNTPQPVAIQRDRNQLIKDCETPSTSSPPNTIMGERAVSAATTSQPAACPWAFDVAVFARHTADWRNRQDARDNIADASGTGAFCEKLLELSRKP
ncbi:hypothetical protein MRX96_043450 [Rhipicephalus microplus]